LAALAESQFIDDTQRITRCTEGEAMKFIPRRVDHGLANLVYVAVCAGCTGCVLYLVATLAAAGV
jgi:hypothetical protein